MQQAKRSKNVTWPVSAHSAPFMLRPASRTPRAPSCAPSRRLATSSIVPSSRLRSELKRGRVVTGCMVVEIRQPSILYALKNGGLDFVIIDNEHGPFSMETVAELSRSAHLMGITPIVRPPDQSYTQITKALDAGAQGIMVPRVTNAKQVQDVVQLMKYPPIGQRGCALGRGWTEFKGGNVSDAMKDANDQSFLIVQVETKEAVDSLDEILSVRHVDAALIGPNDLSIALGVAGQFSSPVLHSAIEKTIAACRKHKVTPAIHVNDLDSAVYWKKKGMQLISVNSEMGYVTRATREVTSALEKV